MQDKVIVHYFKVFGRAEPIRMLLWYGKIPFENKFLPRLDKEPEQFAKVKPTLEFGQAPMVEIDGLRLTDTFAILAYLAEKIGIVPATIIERYLANSAIDLLRDLIQEMFPVFFSPPEAKEVAIQQFQPKFDSKIGYIEKRLKENETQDYLVGKSLTVVDILMMNAYYSFFLRADNLELTIAKLKETLDKHPLFVEYCVKLREKHFKEYFEKVQITPEI